MHLKKFTKPVHIKFPTNNSKETRILNIDKSLMNKIIIYLCMNEQKYYLFVHDKLPWHLLLQRILFLLQLHLFPQCAMLKPLAAVLWGQFWGSSQTNRGRGNLWYVDIVKCGLNVRLESPEKWGFMPETQFFKVHLARDKLAYFKQRPYWEQQ